MHSKKLRIIYLRFLFQGKNERETWSNIFRIFFTKIPPSLKYCQVFANILHDYDHDSKAFERISLNFKSYQIFDDQGHDLVL
jgi:hypothetical protein